MELDDQTPMHQAAATLATLAQGLRLDWDAIAAIGADIELLETDVLSCFQGLAPGAAQGSVVYAVGPTPSTCRSAAERLC